MKWIHMANVKRILRSLNKCLIETEYVRKLIWKLKRYPDQIGPLVVTCREFDGGPPPEGLPEVLDLDT